VPEGDTVYLLARRLNARLRGQVVSRSDVRVPRHATADLAGATLVNTDTHGKHLLTRFVLPDQQKLTLHTHLRMDGSWTVLNPGKRLPRNLIPDIRILLKFQNGLSAAGLKLPVVELLPTDDEDSVIGHLGPDPLRPDWDAAEAIRRLKADGDQDRPLAATLLDQTRMAGLGNLWVNELCFLRGHSPWTSVREVDLEALVALAVRLLRFSVNTPGAAQVTTGNTRPGKQHWVAGRAGQPCLRCRTPIRVVAEVSGDPERRRTWWCPHCQPGPGPDPR
jgi:endonuclease VIII